jgi:hypothetical protein
MTSFGIQARQEMTVIPGVKLVKSIYSEDHKHEVTIRAAAPDMVEIEGVPFELKTHVYF